LDYVVEHGCLSSYLLLIRLRACEFLLLVYKFDAGRSRTPGTLVNEILREFRSQHQQPVMPCSGGNGRTTNAGLRRRSVAMS